MAALEPLYRMFGLDTELFSKKEKQFLEIDLFTRLCNQIKNYFRNQYVNFFRIMKFTLEMEEKMLECNLVRLIIEDILSTEEYTLQGISNYTDTHEDVIQDILFGKNNQPTAIFLRKLIELHRSVRIDIYRTLMDKIVLEYLAIKLNK